jgi:hypothetical protein
MKIKDILGGTQKRKLRRGSRIKRLRQRELLVRESDGKNVHLDHAEELVFIRGKQGVAELVNNFTNLLNLLRGHGDDTTVTTKWDGSPAVFCGIDPADGRFFVGTKGVFAKNAKLNKSIEDIDANHPDANRGGEVVSKEGLRDKLKAALQYLPELGIDGVLQGDLLYTRNDLKKVQINGQPHLAFTPNTITYTVPLNSELGRRILQSQIGIVFHTEYTGDSIETMRASFGFDSSELSPSKNVWYTDARINDVSKQISLTDEEVQKISNSISQLKKHSENAAAFDVLNRQLPIDLVAELKAHANTPIRTGQALEQNPTKFAKAFVERIKEKFAKAIEGLKTEKGQEQKRAALAEILKVLDENYVNIVEMYKAYLLAESIKMMFQRKMRQIRAIDSFIQQPDGSFKVTDPEGFVVVDNTGSTMKIVDRLEFSAANFA